MPKNRPTFVFNLHDCTHFEQGYNAYVMGLPCDNGTPRTPFAFRLGYWWAENNLTFPQLPYGNQVATHRV